MFDQSHPGRGTVGRTPRGERPSHAQRRRAEPEAELSSPPGDTAESGAGLWDEDLAAAAEAMAETQAAIDAALPTGEEALDDGRASLEEGDITRAALQLALVLRIAPALAPAVLDVIGDRHDPGLAFVRGDAYRLVGRELDARRAYADAARPAPPLPEGSPSEGDPA